MAENKTSFVLYADQRGVFEKLSNEQAGSLIKHIFSYVNDESPDGDFVTELAFESIKQQLKRDLDKWTETRQGRSKAGKASAKKRAEQKATNPTNVKSVEQKATNPTVNANVTANANDTVNVNEKNKPITVDSVKQVFHPHVLQCYNYVLPFFEKHLRPKDEKTKSKWLDTIDKLKRIDKIPYKTIVEITKKTRANDFWKTNFLSITKLRKKNKEQIPYIVVFNAQMNKNETGQNKPGETGQGYSQEYLDSIARELQ